MSKMKKESTAEVNLENEAEYAEQSYNVKLQKPSKIKSYLDKYVVGQEDVKKSISVAVYNHYKRIIHQSYGTDSVEIDKSNILMLGSTGTGKTLIAQTLARLLSVPFAIADATTLTEAGYVGEDVENILVRLLQVSDYNVGAAEKGIIYIDEIDKVGRKNSSASITRDVSGEGVQQALLKIIEGTIANLPPKGGRKHPEQSFIPINTRDILFICGGSFSELQSIISKRKGSSDIGFGSEDKISKKTNALDIFNGVKQEDLISFGLIPELIGRLPVVTRLNMLSEKDLLRVILEPKNSLVKQYQKLFLIEGIILDFEKDALNLIVKKGFRKKAGARGLRSVMEEVLVDVMYETPDIKDIERVTITADYIKGVKKPLYILSKTSKRTEIGRAHV